ncbi:MAG: hypothetical protein CVU88_07905 [Firmicutes bacterium HGW-Firmicutes-13]|nr:MAG: hypothetical protein CVU88_07905 [Firmicutes bacterium HGW-Firmicutes-13]
MLLKKIWSLLPERCKKIIYFLRSYWQQGRIVYQAKTPYSFLQVFDKKGYRYLVFKDRSRPFSLERPENIYQSYMSLDNPACNNAPHTDFFHFAWIFNPELKTILMIGLGGGTVPRRFLNDYPEINFKTVEIDPVVVKVAYKYFFLPRDPRHKVIVNDGRNFIRKSRKQVDLILLDAFFPVVSPITYLR